MWPLSSPTSKTGNHKVLSGGALVRGRVVIRDQCGVSRSSDHHSCPKPLSFPALQEIPLCEERQGIEQWDICYCLSNKNTNKKKRENRVCIYPIADSLPGSKHKKLETPVASREGILWLCRGFGATLFTWSLLIPLHLDPWRCITYSKVIHIFFKMKTKQTPLTPIQSESLRRVMGICPILLDCSFPLETLRTSLWHTPSTKRKFTCFHSSWTQVCTYKPCRGEKPPGRMT